jgi:hydrogenase maturation protease
MSAGNILIAGIGNIFFGDDAFGVEVARALADRPLPEGVEVVDFGIRGLDLTYALLNDYDAVILVDAIARGGQPGTLYVLEPELTETDGRDESPDLLDPHALDPHKVLRLARSLGATVERVMIVGCEPQSAAEDEFQMELSQPVQAAIKEAIDLVESLVSSLRAQVTMRPA